MKELRELWHKINEPKIEEIKAIFDKNGKLTDMVVLVDRVPPIRRHRK